ncbi:MAG TPA: hypothetical protein VFY61_19355 [Pyrinomonadaceae bacterium]|nr:hypothetical protein [Pyrinomonadaceae bacterium]
MESSFMVFSGIVLLLQNSAGVLARVWTYLTQSFTFGRITVSISSVLTDPPPRVQFMRFGEYSLDFRLLVWTRTPRRHVQIRSDINYRIFQLFKDRDIKIPYPTQEFLFKGGPLPQDLEPALRGDDSGPRMQD